MICFILIFNMEFILDSLSSLDFVSQKFINEMGDNKVFAFYGEMGVGKTTFIKAICQGMGVTENITSPTFSIVNEYKMGNGYPIYHFDFYRIKNIEEAYDFGYEDYFYSGDYCFIEWPELIETILPPNIVKVAITLSEGERRLITLK